MASGGFIMANVNVTFQDLHAAAARLSGGQADIESKLAELKKYIDGLISSGFVTDKAAPALGAAYDEFTDGAKQTISGLETISRFLTASANAFTETDQQLASSLKG